MTLVPFDEITTDHCLGSYLLDDGMLQTIDCDIPQAATIVTVTTFGSEAPDKDADLETKARALGRVCDSLIDAWYAENGNGRGKVGWTLFPEQADAWKGADTPVVCAIQFIGEE
ncbi:MAG: septum formation family protein [Cellulomonadaceae bacterium]|nr:septum formation family protein [Cellulomonadaceae bacterium]